MKHVIIGAGPAGVIAAETLRRGDPDCSIKLITNEAEAPYSRMALPYFLAGSIGEDGTHLRHGENHFIDLGIDVVNDQVASVSPDKKSIAMADGGEVSFDRLLIATGSNAARPPVPGMDLPGVENCWTLADGRKIAAATKNGSRVVLMGAGFIGCIVLEAMVARGVDLTIVEMEDRMLPRMMDHTGGDMIKRWCQSKGVKVMTSTRVTGIEKSASALTISYGDGTSAEIDAVVVATGVKPNIGFLEGSGIDTDLGVLVDHNLATSKAGIFAAGDVAQGPELLSGNREIHAIQPTASEHGRIAALNMAGHKTHYRGSLSMNVLNTLGLISSSFGMWDGAEGGQEALAVDNDGFRYLRLSFKDDVVVGALALGLTSHVGVIRGLIQTGVKLGHWKDRLMEDPNRVMEAYLACTHGSSAGY